MRALPLWRKSVTVWGILLLIMSGCSHKKKEALSTAGYSCPEPTIVRELSRKILLEKTGEDNEGLSHTGATQISLDRITDYACDFGKGVFSTDAEVRLSATRSLKETPLEDIEATYFITVIAPTGEILSKTEKKVFFSFDKDMEQHVSRSYSIESDPVLLSPDIQPQQLRVRLGLQFTPEEWNALQKHDQQHIDPKRAALSF